MEMTGRFNDEVADEKWRQYVCENSTELKELKRLLQTAYNRRVLESKIASEKVQRLEEKEYNKLAAKVERRTQECFKERIHENESLRKIAAGNYGETLLNQMREKKMQVERDRAEAACEAKLLKIEIEQEQLEEERLAEEQKLKKELLRIEQEELWRHRELLKKREKEESELMEKELELQVSKEHDKNDKALENLRAQRFSELEARKSMIFEKLEEIRKVRQLKEELALTLSCAEKEEKEKAMCALEKEMAQQRRKMSRQNYDDIVRGKLEECELQKKMDVEFGRAIAKKTHEEEEAEKKIALERRRVKTGIRADNRSLMEVRSHLKATEDAEEKAIAAELEAEEAARLEVIHEERLRLLSSFDPSTLGYLPRNYLTETDHINLESLTLK